MARCGLVCPQSDIFEWHFIIRGPRDTEFEVRGSMVLGTRLSRALSGSGTCGRHTHHSGPVHGARARASFLEIAIQ